MTTHNTEHDAAIARCIEEILRPEEPTRRQYLEERDYQNAVRRHAYRIEVAASKIGALRAGKGMALTS
jgi:hypothetical protein